LCDEVAHGLFGHACTGGEVDEARALKAQVARDVDVCGAHLCACREVGQCQRHILVVRHQVQHAGVC
jgi:hypothetical protein